MWIFRKDINKTIAIKNDEFDLIHTIVDGYINNEFENSILFEANGSWYIAVDIDDNLIGYSDSLVLENPLNGQNIYVYYNGVIWIEYSYHPEKKWKKYDTQISLGNYFLDLIDNKLKPYLVESSSDSLGTEYDRPVNRRGAELYKSPSQTGVYEFIDTGQKDDIIVGWKHYTHKAIDSIGNQTTIDVDVYESLELKEVSLNNWVYIYNSTQYNYIGELTSSNFTMTSENGDLSMSFVDYVDLNKDILHYDGGAQIVD